MTTTMALQLFQSPLSASLPSTSTSTSTSNTSLQTLSVHSYVKLPSPNLSVPLHYYCQRMSCSSRRRTRSTAGLVFIGQEETQLRVPSSEANDADNNDDDSSPEDLEYVSQIKRVLELLRKNRDMIFSSVKLTIMIEDPREVERRRLLGIDDSEAPTRDDLAAALEEVNEGKIPKIVLLLGCWLKKLSNGLI